jgi:hypothetical protein
MNKKLNNKNYKKGAALVEFAIISTVMIPLMLYVNFFSELIQFRMKVDEMGYFAAWEMASYGLSNYAGEAYKVDSAFNSAVTDIRDRTYKMYKNLDSADPSKSPGYLMISPDPDSLALTMNKTSAVIPNTVFNNPAGSPQGTGGSSGGIGFDFNKLLNGIDSFLQKGVNYVLGKAFGFNTEGIGSTTTASAGFTISSRMENHVQSDSNIGFTNGKMLQDGLTGGNLATYKSSPFTVWTDTWALKTGENVDNTSDGIKCQNFWGKITGCSNMPYARQVNRMSLLGTWSVGIGIRSVLNIVGSGIIGLLGQIPLIGGVFGADEDVSQARMVSKNYYYTNAQAANIRKGNHTVSISKGQKTFQTSPLVHVFVNNSTQTREGIKEYSETLLKRRNFYMGNDKPNCKFDGLHESCQ